MYLSTSDRNSIDFNSITDDESVVEYYAIFDDRSSY